MVYTTPMQKVLRYASIATMLAREPMMSIVYDLQFARGEDNNVLLCLADGRLSPRTLKQENGRVS